MTVVSAWSRVSDLANGELWVYPGIDEQGARITVRVVTGEKVINWTLAPDEAEMLITVLRKVADADVVCKPPCSPSETQSALDDQDDVLEPFLRQEPAETHSTGNGLMSDIKRFKDNLSEKMRQ